MELLLVNGDLDAARHGDRLALERVLVHSRQNLRRYAEFHCSINDVEDAVQESLVLVSRKIGELRELERFTSWLFRIVTNAALMQRRSRSRRPAESLEAFLPRFDANGLHAATPAELQVAARGDELLDQRTLAARAREGLPLTTSSWTGQQPCF